MQTWRFRRVKRTREEEILAIQEISNSQGLKVILEELEQRAMYDAQVPSSDPNWPIVRAIEDGKRQQAREMLSWIYGRATQVPGNTGQDETSPAEA